MDTNPGWYWSSPTVIVAIVAAVASWIGVWRAWSQARASKSSAEAAKTQVEQATNQATFANSARVDAVRALEQSNKLAAEMAERLAEANVIQASRTQVKYKVRVTLVPNKAKSVLVVRLHNSSIERSVVVRQIGLCSDRSGSCLLALLGSDVPWSRRNVDKDQTSEFRLMAHKAAARYGFDSLATARTLFIEFENPDESRYFDDSQDVQRFAETCGALTQWMKANPQASDQLYCEWDFSGFEPYGSDFNPG